MRLLMPPLIRLRTWLHKIPARGDMASGLMKASLSASISDTLTYIKSRLY